jgi:hypothetical protein
MTDERPVFNRLVDECGVRGHRVELSVSKVREGSSGQEFRSFERLRVRDVGGTVIATELINGRGLDAVARILGHRCGLSCGI